MPRISKTKQEKIAEHIISFLFSTTPEAQYTSEVAAEVARDEEFVKVLLLDLEQKKLVNRITRSPDGSEYVRRARWRLSNKAFSAYQQMTGRQ